MKEDAVFDFCQNAKDAEEADGDEDEDEDDEEEDDKPAECSEPGCVIMTSCFSFKPKSHSKLFMQFRWKWTTVCLLFFCLHSRLSVRETLAYQKVSETGNILLGGLFPIHQKGTTSASQQVCGPLNKDRGVQRAEAMLFAIDKINNDTSLLPGIKLGSIILDTCSSDSYALNQSLEFIRASINTVESSAFKCDDGSNPTPRYEMKTITGVVGGSYSEVSLQVANLLRLFRIPQVSYASTGTSLSDKTRYDFFARTVPPDTFQALALVDLVVKFNWSYVSFVSSEGQYGDSGNKAFLNEAKARNICVAINEKIPHSANATAFDQIFQSLLTKINAKVVVLFVRMEDARGLLQAAQRANKPNFFTWIASDGWGKEEKLVQGVEEVAQGALTVELQSRRVDEFDNYMKQLTPYNNKRNPWFKEFWEETFECRLPSEDESGSSRQWQGDEDKSAYCSPHMRIDETVGYTQETKVQFVVDAVYAFAYALHQAWEDKCLGVFEICKELKEMDGGDFYKQYLLNATFTDIAGSEVRFDSSGDGLGRYNIYNFQKYSGPGNLTAYRYTNVGNWSKLTENEFDDNLMIEIDDIIWNAGDLTPPESICSRPCDPGLRKIMHDKCCWICSACLDYQYLVDEFNCKDCERAWWPYQNKSGCYKLPEQYMQWDSYFALVPIGIALLGILLTLFVVYTFMKFIDTPIVKASGRELSFILLFGILFCYLMTFVLLAKPTILSCAFQRFGVGFGFSLIYGALLTKTNRISRIFDSARKSARRPSFISPKSQVIITMILVSIQVIATLVWFVLEPPGTRLHVPEEKRNEAILKCRVKDSSFLVSLAYNMFLITTCTVYAVKTRKIPENFNESKFIGFTMYTTCIIWLAFVPIYFGTGNSFEIQITTLCVSISLSAYVALFCLFSPKIYIIIFHPDKNVRKLTMNSATYKKAPTSSTNCPTTSNHGSSVDQIKLTVTSEKSSGGKTGGEDSGSTLHQRHTSQGKSHQESVKEKPQLEDIIEHQDVKEESLASL